ncbi:MAG: NAD-dependent epimerase/dehydratase family protein, partial [Leptolyngbya sp. SIO3F4]|nr:NAD-dependent epimerase/dehydratase family protein [Leptolyngbya sp. SIO3F4]
MNSSSHCIGITGGRGFIGSQLTRSLLEQGHTVHLLNRGGSLPSDIANHPNTRVFPGDITDPESLPAWIHGCDQLYHLAAFAKPWAPKKDVFYEVNVQGTLNVLDAARAAGCYDIVITSSAGTFGPQTSVEPIRESTPPQLDPFTEYERTKRISVEQARTYGKDGLKIRFVSPTRVFGPGELNVSNAATKMIDQYLKGAMRIWPGDGNRIGNYVYIRDVVQGHQLAMVNGQHGEDYILGGENASYRTFFN